MSASDSQSTDQLDFVTMNGLLAYGEALAQRTSSGRFVLPPAPPPASDRLPRAEAATGRIKTFIQQAQAGLPSAEAYRMARQGLIADTRGGDPPVFFAARNWLPSRGEPPPLSR